MTGQASRELALTEAAWQQRVMDLALRCHWRVCHVQPSQLRGRWRTATTGSPGFPDLVLSRGGVVLLVELKTDAGRFRPGQREWLEAAGDHGRCWRPADWMRVMEELR